MGLANGLVIDECNTSEQRASAVAINSTASTLGWMIGVYLGGYLVSIGDSGMTISCWISVFCEALCLGIVLFFIPNDSPNARRLTSLPTSASATRPKPNNSSIIKITKMLFSKEKGLRTISIAHCLVSINMMTSGLIYSEYEKIFFHLDAYARSVYYLLSGIVGVILSTNLSTILLLLRGNTYNAVIIFLAIGGLSPIVLPFIPHSGFYWLSILANNFLWLISPLLIGLSKLSNPAKNHFFCF